AQTPLFPTLHTQSDAWLPKFCSWAPLLPADIQGDGNSAVIESCSQSARALLRMPYAAFISAMMHNGQVRLWFDALLQGLPRKVDKRRARLMGPAAALANVDELCHLTCLLCLRLLGGERGQLSPESAGSLGSALYDTWTLHVPRLLDIAGLLAPTMPRVAGAWFSSLIALQPAYLSDVRDTFPTITTTVQEASRKARALLQQHVPDQGSAGGVSTVNLNLQALAGVVLDAAGRKVCLDLLRFLADIAVALQALLAAHPDFSFALLPDGAPLDSAAVAPGTLLYAVLHAYNHVVPALLVAVTDVAVFVPPSAGVDGFDSRHVGATMAARRAGGGDEAEAWIASQTASHHFLKLWHCVLCHTALVPLGASPQHFTRQEPADSLLPLLAKHCNTAFSDSLPVVKGGGVLAVPDMEGASEWTAQLAAAPPPPPRSHLVGRLTASQVHGRRASAQAVSEGLASFIGAALEGGSLHAVLSSGGGVARSRGGGDTLHIVGREASLMSEYTQAYRLRDTLAIFAAAASTSGASESAGKLPPGVVYTAAQGPASAQGPGDGSSSTAPAARVSLRCTLDRARLQYLIDALAAAAASQPLAVSASAPPSPALHRAPSLTTQTSHVPTAVESIQEVLPHISVPYATKAIAHAGGDADAALLALLDGSMPPEEDLGEVAPPTGGTGAGGATPSMYPAPQGGGGGGGGRHVSSALLDGDEDPVAALPSGAARGLKQVGKIGTRDVVGGKGFDATASVMASLPAPTHDEAWTQRMSSLIALQAWDEYDDEYDDTFDAQGRFDAGGDGQQVELMEAVPAGTRSAEMKAARERRAAAGCAEASPA
ncbi:Ascc2, partial [Symbiodinium sp. KB8]